MAVFRVERTRDYTVMSNFHLRDKRLSLKAKGLLSQMLSLPENWDYTLSGLSQINKESKDAIRTAINELENAGYVIRRQTIDSSGKFGVNEYIIHEQPESSPSVDSPSSEEPLSENPTTENPLPEKSTQLNKDISSKDELKKNLSNIDSFYSPPSATAISHFESNGKEAVSSQNLEIYRDIVLENIDYDILRNDPQVDNDGLDEIVELIVETVCSNRKSIRVAGNDFPCEVVKSRLLKLDSNHISFVMKCMRENTTKVRNMKQYLLTALFNAPITIQNYYSALVSHDLYNGSH